MIRVPCLHHLWHDLDDLEIARVVPALWAWTGELVANPVPASALRPGDVALCPRDALNWANDYERFGDYADDALMAAGIIHRLPSGEHAAVARHQRDERADGRPTEPTERIGADPDDPSTWPF